jgi:hypothetical protein
MFLFLAVGGALATASLAWGIRGYAIERRVARLGHPLPRIPAPVLQALRTRTDSAVALGGATLLDLAIGLARIDPKVLDAIDRVHGARAFETFPALQNHITEVMSRGDAAFEGLISTYKGALGELVIADHLTQAGYQVELVSNFTEPGFDILIDGQPFQVKVGLTDASIVEAQDRYPDISILTVEEQGEASFEQSFPEGAEASLSADDVFSVPVEGQALTATTTDTLQGAEGLGDLSFELPVVTAALGVMRGVDQVARGEKDVAQVATEVAVRTAGVGIGAKLGSLISIAFGLGALPGSLVGGFIAGQLLRGESPAASPRRRWSRAHQAEQSFRRFQAACAPTLRQLEDACRRWKHTATDAAHRGARHTRTQLQAIEATSCRRFRDALFPRRSVLIALAARDRLEKEALWFETHAAHLAALPDLEAILDVWASAQPRAAGLGKIDHEIHRLLKALATIANRHRQPTNELQRSPGRRYMPDREVTPFQVNTAWRSACARAAGWCAVTLLCVSVTTLVPAHTLFDHATAEGLPRASEEIPPPLLVEPQVTIGSYGCRLRAAAALDAAVIARVSPGGTCRFHGYQAHFARATCEERRGYLHRDCLAQPRP